MSETLTNGETSQREQINLESLKAAELQFKANEFYNAGLEAMDNYLVLDERPAKDLVLTNLVDQHNGILIANTGTGKSTLINNAHRLINLGDERAEGEPSEEECPPVVYISANAELKSIQFNGGTMSVDKLIKIGDEQRLEQTINELKAIITFYTRYINADEINRSPTEIWNAMLEIAEDRRKRTIDGRIVELPMLLGVLATQNPGENKEGTFASSHALASRFSKGVVMGVNSNLSPQNRADNVEKVCADLWTPQPDKILPIATPTELEMFKAGALRLPFDGHARKKVKEMIPRATDVLRDEKYKVDDGDLRIARQIGRMSRVLAYLRCSKIDEEILDICLDLLITARVGMLTQKTSVSTHDKIQDALKTIDPDRTNKTYNTTQGTLMPLLPTQSNGSNGKGHQTNGNGYQANGNGSNGFASTAPNGLNGDLLPNKSGFFGGRKSRSKK